MVNEAFLRYVPFDELQKPKNGYQVFVDHWWIVHPEKGAVFYQRLTKREALGAPQCNRDKNVAEHIHSRLYKNMEIRQIPLAYVKWDYD